MSAAAPAFVPPGMRIVHWMPVSMSYQDGARVPPPPHAVIVDGRRSPVSASFGRRKPESRRTRSDIRCAQAGTGSENTDQKAFRSSLSHLVVGVVKWARGTDVNLTEVVLRGRDRRRVYVTSLFKPHGDSPTDLDADPGHSASPMATTGAGAGTGANSASPGKAEDDEDVEYCVQHYNHWQGRVALLDQEALATMFNTLNLNARKPDKAPLAVGEDTSYPGATVVDVAQVKSMGLFDTRRNHANVYLPRSAVGDVETPVATFRLPAQHRQAVPLPAGTLVVGTMVRAGRSRGFRMRRIAPCSMAVLAFVALARHGTTQEPGRLRLLLQGPVHGDKLWMLLRVFLGDTANLSFLPGRRWRRPLYSPDFTTAQFVLELAAALRRDRIAQSYFDLPTNSGAGAVHEFRERWEVTSFR